ncbi:MAG: PAS domain-containing protein [Parvibaculum sp.]|uniref:PAS domain-containing protein n=1 Tax=Parvibaculum sp. TaxID=2024848 RepID=UPI0032EB60E8
MGKDLFSGGAAAMTPPRSALSLAFEKAWSAIPKNGARIPDKADFRPERFARFLPDMYLVELHDVPGKRVPIRLAGNNIRDHLGVDVKGMNYADFVPPERQHIAGASMPKMFTSPPCGRWVRKDILHKDGYREVIEMTQLPLFEAKTGTRLVIGLIEGFGAELHGEGQFHFEGREAEVFFEPA